MCCASGAAAHQGTPTTKCKAPKGTRAPTRNVKAGYATSCATAQKVAKAWDNVCEPSGDRLCSVTVAGNRWSCALVGLYRSALYIKCALAETTRGRPAVKFQQI